MANKYEKLLIEDDVKRNLALDILKKLNGSSIKESLEILMLVKTTLLENSFYDDELANDVVAGIVEANKDKVIL